MFKEFFILISRQRVWISSMFFGLISIWTVFVLFIHIDSDAKYSERLSAAFENIKVLGNKNAELKNILLKNANNSQKLNEALKDLEIIKNENAELKSILLKNANNSRKLNEALNDLEKIKNENAELKSILLKNANDSRKLNEALKDIETLKNKNVELNKDLKDAKSNQGLMKALNDKDILKNGEILNLLKECKILNETLKTVVKSRDLKFYNSILNAEGPSLEYENSRRQMFINVKEFWNYLNTELRKIKKETVNVSSKLATELENIIDQATEHKVFLQNSFKILKNSDRHESWRLKEFNDLSALVQKRFEYLQHPKDCANAKKLLCYINKDCGFGCQLHHVTYCFVVAYATQRTLILLSKGWKYAPGGWEEFFEPFSKTCTSWNNNNNNVSTWLISEETQHINLTDIDTISPRPSYLPLSIPKDLEPRLSRIHGDPIVWWIGQILKYMLKPQLKTKKFLKKYLAKIKFQKPIVGLHIRRTDKIEAEADFHGVNEYMIGVEEYYKELALKQPVKEKRVYVATDDPQVLTDLKENYTDYIVLGDSHIAETATLDTRYSETSLMGIITDIHFLSLSDYLVCTFSSQICRVAYEIMNHLKPDASLMYRSLDDIYYFGGQTERINSAIIAHSPQNHEEIELIVGDKISVAGNLWNGYSVGTNRRTGKSGKYPTFKVVNQVQTAEFPTYPQVPS